MTLLFSELGLPEHARPLARLIRDYDHYLSLEKLPDGHPWLIDNPDRPYAVIHRHPGMREYVWNSYPESMLDERILAELMVADAEKHGGDLSAFDPIGTAKLLLEGRKREDEEQEKADRYAFLKNRRYDRGPRHF